MALCNYFGEKKFVGDVAVVDIGWNGSMQKCLAELMRLADIHVTIHGYYFGIRKQISETSMQGYIYDPKHMQYETSLSFMQGLFESFFLSQEGSTKKYEIKDNIAKPILYTPEYVETDKEFKALKAVQSGALEFCRLFSESILADHAVRKEDFLQNFLALTLLPVDRVRPPTTKFLRVRLKFQGRPDPVDLTQLASFRITLFYKERRRKAESVWPCVSISVLRP